MRKHVLLFANNMCFGIGGVYTSEISTVGDLWFVITRLLVILLSCTNFRSTKELSWTFRCLGSLQLVVVLHWILVCPVFYLYIQVHLWCYLLVLLDQGLHHFFQLFTRFFFVRFIFYFADSDVKLYNVRNSIVYYKCPTKYDLIQKSDHK